MISHRAIYGLLIAALWLSMAVLSIFTAISAIASFNRSDCGSSTASVNSSYSNVTVVGGTDCTSIELLSRAVYRHSSYFQSAHIIVIRLVGGLTLIVFRPALTDMVWKALRTFNGGIPMLRVTAFQEAVGLSTSPALISAALYARASRTLPFKVLFVLLVTILSLLSPLAVSPIYKSHLGPYSVNATLDTGGGVGPATSLDYDINAVVPGGLSIGRGLLEAGILLGTPVFPSTFDVSVAPFLSLKAMEEIWSAEIDTVVARNTLDCSPSALDRLNSSIPVVALDEPVYFTSDVSGVTTSSPVFLGVTLGDITNDPQVTAVYLNSTISVQPGAVAAETTVIFLGANATLEGAQQTITSPTPGSRILFVDVLVCTSKTTLEPSHCTINQGNLTSCIAYVPANAAADTSGTGGLNVSIAHPSSTALLLAASPATAFYTLPGRLPMYIINNSTVASGVPPTSDLTLDITGDVYHVPLNYITDVVFGQTAQALVQGLAQAFPVAINQSLELQAIFGISRPQLLYVILSICAGCALAATFSGMWSFRQHHAPLDIVRLLAISRNDKLDDTFAPYADLSMPVSSHVLEKRIGYTWVEELGSYVLVVDSGGSSDSVNIEDQAK